MLLEKTISGIVNMLNEETDDGACHIRYEQDTGQG